VRPAAKGQDCLAWDDPHNPRRSVVVSNADALNLAAQILARLDPTLEKTREIVEAMVGKGGQAS
jgi:hypothetical protein